MNIKKRVLVCGTGFGQQYLKAISQCESLELVGIVSKGSVRSGDLAREYGVPLYVSVDEAPKVDIAFVVVRTSVMGGDGTNISIALLEKGIHVMTEQPMHFKDIAQCCKIAAKNNVCFWLGNLYHKLRPAKIFIQSVRDISKHQKPLYINVDCSMQVLYPVVCILQEALQGLRPCTTEECIKNEEVPFTVITGKIRDIPFNFRIHNEVYGNDSDNFFHLLYSVTIGFKGGRLVMEDTHGCVYWHPRFYVTEKTPENVLSEQASLLLGSSYDCTFGEISQSEWSVALREDIEDFCSFIWDKEHKKIYNAKMQNMFLCAQIWQEFTKAAGYPAIRNSGTYEYIPRSVFSLGTVRKNNANSIPPFGRISPDVLFDRIKRDRKEYDPFRIEKAKKRMEKYTASVILNELLRQGAFSECGRLYSADEIIKSVDIKQGFGYIIHRWLKYLCDMDVVKGVDDGYILETKDGGIGLPDVLWVETSEVWTGALVGETVTKYLQDNVKQLSYLMNGQKSAADILFPEGSMEMAASLYRDTVTADYLNSKAADVVCELLKNAGQKISILEVGAGTGSTTEKIVNIIWENNMKCVDEYIFSDISSYFFGDAEKKFGNFVNMSFKKINVDEELQTQGIVRESQHIVIANGVLNNSKDINRAVSRLFDVLVPGGYILIIEPTNEPPEMLISQVFMMERPVDVRADTGTTFVPEKEWKKTLVEQGGENIKVFPEMDHPLKQLGQNLFIAEKRM